MPRSAPVDVPMSELREIAKAPDVWRSKRSSVQAK
jgi:hypothetical protein